VPERQAQIDNERSHGLESRTGAAETSTHPWFSMTPHDFSSSVYYMETVSTSSQTHSAAEVHALEPSIQTIWSIKRAAFVAFVSFGVLFYDIATFLGPDSLPFGLITGTVVVLGVLYAFFWPRLLYNSWGVSIRSEEIYIEHGVLNHIRTIVPLRRIQHLDVSQDLLEREFSLGRLVVHTAGSRSSDVVIPGLNLKDAERIRDQVKQYILEDPLMEDPV